MSRNYDNWDRLVEAVLRREKDRQLAYCESLSTCYSSDLSSRFSFDSAVEDADFSFNLFVGDVHLPPVMHDSVDSVGSPMLERVDSFGSEEEVPGIEGLQIIGDAKPGGKLLVCGFPVRGTSLCMFQWIRHYPDGTIQYIEGATNPDYVVTADDVDTFVSVECMSMNELGRKGDLVRSFANDSNKITCDGEMQEEIDGYISQGLATFKVLILSEDSEKWEPAPLLLRRSGFKDKITGVSRSPRQNLHPSQLCSENMLFFCDAMAIEYEEIKKATKNFQPELLLGEGGFGPVFKGWLHEHYLTAVNPGSGIAVAVKKLNKGGCQGRKEWMNEIRYLRQIHHPNTIKLIGCSFETDNRIVVYEFMPRGSLENHLFGSMQETLPWATRMKVAVGTARAVAFLHGLEIPVMHRNIKSGDILLDADFNPKLSDFGLAIDGPTGDMTHVEIQVMGTIGYAAPEYVATGHLRCDVYGFGVVLLELLSGLRVMDTTRPEGKRNLMTWVITYRGSKRKLSRIMDRRLKGKYPPKKAYKVAQIALQCTRSDPSLRPTMVEVVDALENV